MSSLQDPPDPVQSAVPTTSIDFGLKSSGKDLRSFKELLYEIVTDERTEPEVKLALTEAYQRIDETYAGYGEDFIFDDPILVHALYGFKMP